MAVVYLADDLRHERKVAIKILRPELTSAVAAERFLREITITAGLVCWQGLKAAIVRRGGQATPTFGLLVLAAAAGLGFGALNEVVEFVATLLVPETNVGGYRNTGWDLVANLVGATVAATAIWMGAVRRERVKRAVRSIG